MSPLHKHLAEHHIEVYTTSNTLSHHIDFGIVLLADTAIPIKIGVVDNVIYYPTWIEDKRSYNPDDYPKATYIYGLDCILNKGLNIIGWSSQEPINYISSNTHPGKPYVYLTIDAEQFVTQQYSIKNLQSSVYTIHQSPDFLPACHRIYTEEMAHPSLCVLGVRGAPLSLFTSSYLACMTDFFCHNMQQLEFEEGRGKVTKHVLTLLS